MFSFFPNGRPANGLEEALFRYRTIAPLLRDRLSGPTTFAPLIYEALKVVAATGQYHILVIVADGQVSEGVHTAQTIQAIVDASQFPLSIVMIGVGDGPWEMMKAFDDLLPERAFDNFQVGPAGTDDADARRRIAESPSVELALLFSFVFGSFFHSNLS